MVDEDEWEGIWKRYREDFERAVEDELYDTAFIILLDATEQSLTKTDFRLPEENSKPYC